MRTSTDRLAKLIFTTLIIIILMSCDNSNGADTEDKQGHINSESLVLPLEDNTAIDTEALEPDGIYNPLNGLYDWSEYRKGQRVIGVAVSNIQNSWPVYGISGAEVVIEIETGGGITRFLCLYSDPSKVECIGSIRSASNTMLELLSPMDTIEVCMSEFNHDLTAYTNEPNDHIYVISDWSLRNKNANAFYRNIERINTYSSEHNMFTDSQTIYKAIEAAELSVYTPNLSSFLHFVPYSSEPMVPKDSIAENIIFCFYDPTNSQRKGIATKTDGDFRYDNVSGRYMKYQFGEPQLDGGANIQISFDNILIISAEQEYLFSDSMDELSYNIGSGGIGWYFCGGRYEKVLWEKDDNGITLRNLTTEEEVLLNPGNTYIALIPREYEETVVVI